jgi:poly(hydroxyalkanoate) granule-associated protein
MSETVEATAEEPGKERNALLDLARKVMLASIGAVSLAQEEAEAFIHKLIERGEIAEKDGNILLSDLREKRKKRIAQAEEELEQRITKLLERMNVPTKSDFETLSEKIASLTQKVEDLIKAKA